MTLLDWLIGGIAGIAAAAAFAMYAWSVVLRERRGPDAHRVTLRQSRPVFTTLFVFIAAVGVALLVLRLGVLS